MVTDLFMHEDKLAVLLPSFMTVAPCSATHKHGSFDAKVLA